MRKALGRDLLLALLCSTAALTAVVHAGGDAAPSRPGVSETGEPHAAEWRAAVQRLEDAYKKSGDGALPDDDPQMREDFLTLAKLDPAEALQFLTLHPLKSGAICFGILRYTLKFYVPGLSEIGRTSPDLLANWLISLDKSALQGSNVFGDGAAALAEAPDALGKLFQKNAYNLKTLVGYVAAGATSREKFSLVDFAERYRNSKHLSPTYRDQILLQIATIRGQSIKVEELGSLIAAAHSSGYVVKILSEVVSRTAADHNELMEMLNLTSPDLALAALNSGPVRSSFAGDSNRCLYTRDPDAFISILGKASPTKASEYPTADAVYLVRLKSAEKLRELLNQWPVSEWKKVLDHERLVERENKFWWGNYSAYESLAPERHEELKKEIARVEKSGLSASIVDAIRPEERATFFMKAVGKSLQVGGEFLDWDAGARTYAANASLVSPEDRVLTAKNFSIPLAAESPETAVEWFSHLTGEAEREEAARGIVSGWAELDIQAAAKWLVTVRDPKAKKAGAQAMVEQLVGGDTPMRREWQHVAEGE